MDSPNTAPEHRSDAPGSSDAARTFPLSRFDLTPIRVFVREKVAPELPRTPGRHPRLKGASIEQLLAVAGHRDRRGFPTTYAVRAASRLLGLVMRAEREFDRLERAHRRQHPTCPGCGMRHEKSDRRATNPPEFQ